MNLIRRAAFVTPLLMAAALSGALVPMTGQAATVQGSGTSVTENRSVTEFQAISTSGSMDLVVRQGAQQVQVQADDNLVPMIETYVETGNQGATLFVRWKKSSSYWTRSKVLVTVSVPKLSAISTSGSGDIKLEAFNTPALKVSLSGSGDARLNALTTDDLGIRISGSGDVSANGKASKLSVSIAGSGDVRLADLRSDDVQVQIAGSGDATLNAEKTLTVSIAGSGDVSYTGNPTVKSSVAGSGSVTKR
jgi:Putative auto-transporter adhesin, head GIN domain